ncbi:MAG: nucleoside deaminase [Desulfobacterales bacterium]|nr:nucleoside deaminase [Desulfobacterales bacterium]
MDDEKFMKLALAEAQNALAAGEFPVGCILLYKGEVLVTGARTGTTGGSANEVDHAEMVALHRLAELDGDIESKDISLYCTMEPCLMCYAAVMLAGIGRIVYAYEDAMGGGTGCDLSSLPEFYAERAPEIVHKVLRNESLCLFKKFFKNPDMNYWNGSYLADYTLRQ